MYTYIHLYVYTMSNGIFYGTHEGKSFFSEINETYNVICSLAPTILHFMFIIDLVLLFFTIISFYVPLSPIHVQYIWRYIIYTLRKIAPLNFVFCSEKISFLKVLFVSCTNCGFAAVAQPTRARFDTSESQMIGALPTWASGWQRAKT